MARPGSCNLNDFMDGLWGQNLGTSWMLISLNMVRIGVDSPNGVLRGSNGTKILILRINPCFLPETCLPLWGSNSFETVAYLGRVILLVSQGLSFWVYVCQCAFVALGRMILHLSPSCLPLVHFSPGKL